MMFLDPSEPLSTCDERTCEGCPVAESLVCHFNAKQLLLFLIMALPIFLAGGFAVARYNPRLLIPWILFMPLYFGFIEIRVMCSHCPHYAEPGLKSLKCWANYGSPKPWKYRPGPMSLLEKVIFFAGLAVLFIVPALLLAFLGHWLFFSVYSALLALWVILLRRMFCRRCINFACPLNPIDHKTRTLFFARNSGIRKSWKE